MSYHDKTLALLETPGPARDTSPLERWAARHDIELPASFLEWAKLDGAGNLYRFSNMDPVFLDQPNIVDVGHGNRGLLYRRENQGNCDWVALLDHGDDPPVLFGWLGKAPWIEHCSSFSEAVFAQIFDHQWMFEPFGDQEHNYTAELDYRNPAIMDELPRRYSEVTTTRYLVYGKYYVERRFVVSDVVRITSRMQSDGQTTITITGDEARVVGVERQLLPVAAEYLVRRGFLNQREAIEMLARRAVEPDPVRARLLFLNPPSPQAIETVAAAARQDRLSQREDVNRRLPAAEEASVVGGPELGFRVRLVRADAFTWHLDRLELV